MNDNNNNHHEQATRPRGKENAGGYFGFSNSPPSRARSLSCLELNAAVLGVASVYTQHKPVPQTRRTLCGKQLS